MRPSCPLTMTPMPHPVVSPKRSYIQNRKGQTRRETRTQSQRSPARDGSAAGLPTEANVFSFRLKSHPLPALWGRSIRLAALTLALCLTPCAAAQAARIGSGACNDPALTSPFPRWGDSHLYELVPQ